MDIPKKIKIGYKDYVIEPMDNANLSLGNYAMINHRSGRIKCDSSVDDIEVVDSLMHEILHGIKRQYGQGRDISIDDEEYYVGIFSTGLTGVLRDNPEFLLMMQKAFGHWESLNDEEARTQIMGVKGEGLVAEDLGAGNTFAKMDDIIDGIVNLA